MNAPKKKEYRKRHLFARSLEDVVKSATKPMMDKQGKVYGALLANWLQIVGPERAAFSRPAKLQFPTTGDAKGATLHLNVHPAKAPEMQYQLEPILEQCARYFGYRAIERIVCHASHDMVKTLPPAPTQKKPAVADGHVADMRELLQRVRARIMSDAPNDKKNS